MVVMEVVGQLGGTTKPVDATEGTTTATLVFQVGGTTKEDGAGTTEVAIGTMEVALEDNVQEQSVMVNVVESVTVYVLLPMEKVVGLGQTVVRISVVYVTHVVYSELLGLAGHVVGAVFNGTTGLTDDEVSTGAVFKGMEGAVPLGSEGLITMVGTLLEGLDADGTAEVGMVVE